MDLTRSLTNKHHKLTLFQGICSCFTGAEAKTRVRNAFERNQALREVSHAYVAHHGHYTYENEKGLLCAELNPFLGYLWSATFESKAIALKELRKREWTPSVGKIVFYFLECGALKTLLAGGEDFMEALFKQSLKSMLLYAYGVPDERAFQKYLDRFCNLKSGKMKFLAPWLIKSLYRNQVAKSGEVCLLRLTMASNSHLLSVVLAGYYEGLDFRANKSQFALIPKEIVLLILFYFVETETFLSGK